ncbi:lysozyme, partial [Cronobacter malonaticus]|uniref:lysozyme n=1 Tax=Cronobacter malonaticus TaxID=413503 RepID=UPI000CFBFDA7
MKMPDALRKALIAASVGGPVAIASVFIEWQEGVSLTPYPDPVGIPTVCAGVTGVDVVTDKAYSDRECRALLAKHMQPAVEAVNRGVRVTLNDYQKAALYSFTYNVGIRAFRRSTLLTKLNRHDLNGACDELRRWTWA